MKKWLRTLEELSKWTRFDPSAPDLTYYLFKEYALNRYVANVRRDLKMLHERGMVRRIEPEHPDTKGLQSRWRITEAGKKRLRLAGLEVG
jgi:hypothetical protein